MIKLEVVQGQNRALTHETDTKEIVIGRSDSVDVKLNDHHLSGEHGLIFFEQDKYIYRDLRSTNGSMLLRKQQRILLDGTERWEIPLQDGDRLLLGDATSPVIILCRIHEKQKEENVPRVLASREKDDLDQISIKIEKSQDMPRLYQALKTLSADLALDKALNAISNAVFELISRATHLSILLADKDNSERFTPMLARSKKESDDDASIMMSRSVLKRVLKERQAILAADAAGQFEQSESIMAANIRSTIAVPLWHGDAMVGVIEIDNRASSGMFSEKDLDLLLVLGQQAALSIANAQLYTQLQIAQEQLLGENTYLKRKQKPVSFENIIGEAKSMQKIFKALERVIDTRATVCIYGETGTGKELIASAIHHQGRRNQKMFVAQNCAALPENLLESELFGHKKGAFTGADQDKKGLFELADGGTLFLDEIGEMPLSLQAKLLRVLQEGELRPVGSTKTKRVDVRIICATNRDLQKEVEAGHFREDLYYRLMVFPITLPPLRERRDDIPLLFNHFLAIYSAEMKKAVKGISAEAMNYLIKYNWQGNIRQLENEVQRLVIQVDEDEIVQIEHLSPSITKDESVVDQIRAKKGTLKEMMESVERSILISALKDHDNNKTKTAASLGITREGLHKKLSKHGI